MWLVPVVGSGVAVVESLMLAFVFLGDWYGLLGVLCFSGGRE